MVSISKVWIPLVNSRIPECALEFCPMPVPIPNTAVFTAEVHTEVPESHTRETPTHIQLKQKYLHLYLYGHIYIYTYTIVMY